MDILLLKFLALNILISGIIIFFLYRLLVVSTEGAVRRLNEEAEQARFKEAELTRKIKEMNEELTQRREEAGVLIKKMLVEEGEEIKKEREKIIQKAMLEAEEIVNKAHGSTDKIRKELEFQVEVRAVNHAMNILSEILSEKARGLLHQQLLKEFIVNLEKIDMAGKSNADVALVQIISPVPMEAFQLEQMRKMICSKFQREVKAANIIEADIMGGIILKFGSLILDGSLRSQIKEAAAAHKQKAESRA